MGSGLSYREFMALLYTSNKPIIQLWRTIKVSDIVFAFVNPVWVTAVFDIHVERVNGILVALKAG